MKKNLAKKITMSILAGAMLMSSSVVWAGSDIVNSASGSGAIAIGAGSSDSPKADGISSVAIGNAANATGYQAVAIGLRATATANGSSSVAIGDGAIADAPNVVSVGNGGADPNYRRIINVKDGTSAHDAATVGQMKTELGKKADKATTLKGYGITDAYTKTEADELLGKKANAADVYTKTEANGLLEGKADKTALETEATTRAEKDDELLAMINKVNGGASDAIAGINQRLDKTNAKINKVGAGAAALAALHPLEYDPDDKLTFSAGMGNYVGENAAALGAFYRPNEKFMVSLGGTMGNGENMVNLGLSIGLDKPNGYAKLSKRELIQEVNAVKAENNMLIQKVDAVEAENEAIKAEMAEMKAMLQAIMAKK